MTTPLKVALQPLAYAIILSLVVITNGIAVDKLDSVDQIVTSDQRVHASHVEKLSEFKSILLRILHDTPEYSDISEDNIKISIEDTYRNCLCNRFSERGLVAPAMDDNKIDTTTRDDNDCPIQTYEEVSTRV